MVCEALDNMNDESRQKRPHLFEAKVMLNKMLKAVLTAGLLITVFDGCSDLREDQHATCIVYSSTEALEEQNTPSSANPWLKAHRQYPQAVQLLSSFAAQNAGSMLSGNENSLFCPVGLYHSLAILYEAGDNQKDQLKPVLTSYIDSSDQASSQESAEKLIENCFLLSGSTLNYEVPVEDDESSTKIGQGFPHLYRCGEELVGFSYSIRYHMLK